MTLCRELTLVKHHQGITYAKPLVCRSWNCEYCAPMRKSRLMAQAASGSPNRFLTLTVNPVIGSSPDERLLLLSNAWRTCVKRLRRLYGQSTIQYLAIVEATERGEPHLHILLRAPYIPQGLLSQIMSELIESPIVDIRAIKGAKQVIRYVAKYVTKNPHHFGTGKRYWSTQAWELPRDLDPEKEAFYAAKWHIDHRRINEVARYFIHEYGMFVLDSETDLWKFVSSPPA